MWRYYSNNLRQAKSFNTKTEFGMQMAVIAATARTIQTLGAEPGRLPQRPGPAQRSELEANLANLESEPKQENGHLNLYCVARNL